MKKFAVLLFVLAGFASSSIAQMGFTVGADAFNSYIWRGGKLGKAAVQPSIDYLSPYGVGVNVWTSFHGENFAGATTSEIDYTIYYSYAFESFTLSAGYINYVASLGAPMADNTKAGADFVGNVSEVNVGVKFQNVLLAPSVKVYKNIAASDNNKPYEEAMYIEAAGGYDFELSGDYKLSTSLTVGLGNDTYTKDGDLGVCNVFPKVSLPLTFSGVSVTPSVGYIFNPSAFTGADDSFVVAGVGVYYAF
ncbi:MAG: hypothetical protein L6Q77_13355 [Bacteroidetes bacterium]|nr:hypothetical protein [Bacteroidota bacterium]